MVSEELKEAMLEVVDNQLNDNDPKCTTDTFERLVASGCSPQEAKEQIAEVLLDRTTASLVAGKAFDEEDFSRRLDYLKGKGQQHPDTDYTSKNTMDEIVKRIEYIRGTVFPEEELKEIIARKEEAIPLLLNILRQVRDNPEKYISRPDYFGHNYAIYLLAQFRVEEAYPIVFDIFSLPNDMAFDLLGDVMTEAGGRIIASLCGDDLESIKRMINNEVVDEYTRVQAVNAFAVLAMSGDIPRETVIDYYRELFHTLDNSTMLSMLINTCVTIYPGELYDEIKEAYKNNPAHSEVVRTSSVDRAMKKGKAAVLADASDNKYLHKIEDTIAELRDWGCFENEYNDEYDDYDDEEDFFTDLFFDQLMKNNPDFISQIKRTPIVNEPKIGRNDPCPCGSGKKYKKCCGK